jgi:hypothetical protein
VSADGEISQEEQGIAEEIKASIQGAHHGVFGKMGKLVGNSVNRRAQVVENAPNREIHLMIL